MNLDDKLQLGALAMFALSIVAGFVLMELGYTKEALIEQCVVTLLLSAVAAWRIVRPKT